MPTLPVTLIKGDKVSGGVDTDYRDQLLVNFYAVEKQILGAQGYLLDYPGLTQIGTGSGIDRGGIYNERFEDQYRVSGTKFISVSPSGATTELGTVSGSDQATLEGFYSFNTQGLIANGKFYLYDSTNGFRQVRDSDARSPIDGIWINNYYFMPDGEYLFHTEIGDESSIDPLDFATAEFMPDPSLGLSKTQDNKVMVWGRYTLEYFVDVANDNFAFTRVDTRAQKIGIVATHAKCESKGVWYITGGRKEEAVGIHAVTLGSSTKVSTREIDKILKQYTEPELSDMRMECRMEDDVTFILVHLPNETLCFNENVAGSLGVDYAWSILKTDIKGDQTYRGINGVFDARSAKWVYGDKRDSKIGRLNNDICTHYGDKVEGILYAPLLNLDGFSVNELNIQTIPGFTNVDGAKVAISQTQDGDHYGTEVWCDYGDAREYGKRFYKRRLGYVRDFVGYKFRKESSARMAFALMTLEYS